jgi:hypothetical protein
MYARLAVDRRGGRTRPIVRELPEAADRSQLRRPVASRVTSTIDEMTAVTTGRPPPGTSHANTPPMGETAVYTAAMAGHHELAKNKDRSRVMDDPWQDPGAFLHIHSVLAGRIRDGEYPAGAQLPTERELAREFGCGPGVAAQALRALQRDGLARKVLWKGYFSFGPVDRQA